jgi:tetratricopeptide (TPR) repeat protein
VDGYRNSDNDSSLLLRKGQPDPSTVVVLHQEVYAELRQAAVARLPGGTAGALLGSVQAMGGQNWYNVREAATLDLQFTESGLTPDRVSLDRLRERMEGEPWHELSVIGMFYADPEIGLFPARLDIGEIHRQLTPDAGLLLLMNPSIDQGAFCLWREGMMLPVGGFYEALPEQSTSIIPWTGDWATMLIGAAGTLRRGTGPVEGRTERASRHDAPPDGAAQESAANNGSGHFTMRSTARPEREPTEPELREEEPEPETAPEQPEENMASEAVGRIMTLARRLESEGNLTGAVLLYRQALSLSPIIGDIALELRLRSTLSRLEEQVSLLEQDITEAATAAWAEARERAEREDEQAAAREKSASQQAGRQRTAVDELFDLGLAAFWQGDLLHARNILAEVVRHEPTYRTDQHRAANLLAGIERRLALPPPSAATPAAEVKRGVTGSRIAMLPWKIAAIVGLPLVALVLVMLFALSSAAPARGPETRPAATPLSQALPSTSETPVMSPQEEMSEFVATNGGTARFGQPVSPLIEEVSDGITHTVQYFERGLLQFDASAAPGERVILLPIGKLELSRRYPQGLPAGDPPAGNDLYFEATGFAISGAIREFWEQQGNATALGRPVSGTLQEVAEEGGAVSTQYFEFGSVRKAAVEPASPVQWAPLGVERYRALHGTP